MNISRLLAALLLAPVGAAASPHAVVVRASQGSKSYAHTAKAEAGAQTNFAGESGGQSMIVNTMLARKGDVFKLSYQLEVSRPDLSRSFQVQSSILLRPGDRVTAVECGDWKLDISLDAPKGAAMPQAWSPAGPNHRLTAIAGKRRCRLVQEAGTQSNVMDYKRADGRRTGFIFNAMLASPVANTCNLQYQIENSPLTLQGEEALVLGRKASVRGGKAEFLLEGPAPAPASAAPSRAAAPEQQGGAVPLLR